MFYDKEFEMINKSFIDKITKHALPSVAVPTEKDADVEIPNPIYDAPTNKWILIDSDILLDINIEYMTAISELLLSRNDKAAYYFRYYRNAGYSKALNIVRKKYPNLFYNGGNVFKKSELYIQSLVKCGNVPYVQIQFDKPVKYEYGMSIIDVIPFISGTSNDVKTHIRLLSEFKNEASNYEQKYSKCKVLENIKNDMQRYINNLSLSDEDKLLYALNGLI